MSNPATLLPPDMTGERLKGFRGKHLSAGSVIKKSLNKLATFDPTIAQLRAWLCDPKSRWSKKAAAKQMLEAVESPTIADFAKFLHGEQRLDELPPELIEAVEAVTIRPTKFGEARSVKLFDRRGREWSRISVETDPKPEPPASQVLVVVQSGDGAAAAGDSARLPSPTAGIGGETDRAVLVRADRATAGVPARPDDA